ncbi:MAG TPA: hypothetical protein H9800_04590 [Candidatus Microbacterium stercoravium]|uniref:YtxH domain-containing protein n=1 Tax=Candidatus Microbacterium stercoravium TaxID=2838697 RepID=A0A9D2H591_9MICO|nr:hypothetical protein [Candidatus Microbacterium stercoravium]
MMKNLGTMLMIAAVGIAGYVLGAQAGRSRYEEISGVAKKVWDDPKVKKARKRTSKKVEKAAESAARKLGL